MSSTMRAVWRRLRSAPLLGAAIRAVDRFWWARAITRSGLADADYYAAQRGWESADVSRAIRDYVRRGYRAGFSLNPLVDELIAGRGLPEPDRVPSLYAYLVSDRHTVSLHPWWDAPAASVDGQAPPLETAWTNRATAEVTLSAGGIERLVPVESVREWAISAARQWQHGRFVDALPESSARRDAVVRLVQGRDRDYPRRILLAASLADDHCVVVGVVGAEPSQWVGLDILARLIPGFGRRAFPGPISYVDAVEACIPPGISGGLCVVGPRSDLTTDQVRRLMAGAVPGTAVAPAELADDGTIASVGAAGTGGALPYRLLAGHPAEDLDAFGGRRVQTPLLSGPTFAVAGVDWYRVGGLRGAGGTTTTAVEALTSSLRLLTPGFTCHVDTGVVSTAYARPTPFSVPRTRAARVRLADDRDGAAMVLQEAGFRVTGWRRHRGAGTMRPRLEWLRPRPDALRWAIKISSPPGPAGAVWGDTHFAEGLATALRRQGQTVVIDSFAARERTSAYLDDVSLIVRGPYRIRPPRTGVGIEWIISHPDKITRQEVTDFDLVYAASDRWSRRTSLRWGVPITSMLECTDAHRFFPRDLPRTDDIVFVGTSRGIARPSVVVPLRAGIPVKVYGPDWRTHIPASAIVATSIPNSELSVRYETASVVLNDQWPAMQREGFIAMRPFDAVAAGGRVISEYVDGIEAVFGDAVPVFRTPDELLRLLQEDPAVVFPDEAGLREASARIRRDHSFDARATQLLAAARERLAVRNRPGSSE